MRGEILGLERRRIWRDEDKLEIVMSVGVDGASVWTCAAGGVLPVSTGTTEIADALLRRTRWWACSFSLAMPSFRHSPPPLSSRLTPSLTLFVALHLSRAMTIIETAKLNNLDPLVYLADALDRIHKHKINRLNELIAWNWAPLTSAVASQAPHAAVIMA